MPRNAAGNGDDLEAVACPGTGDCVAGGGYTTNRGKPEAVTVTQFHGRWHRAGELRLPPAAAFDPGAGVTGVACGQAGSCVAVGTYLASDRHPKIGPDEHGFFAIDSHGTWTRARTVTPPRNAYRSGYGASMSGVACPKPGWCEAIGNYTDKRGRHESFAIAQVGGHWQRPVELEMPPGAATNPRATLTGISCWRARFCAAVGSYFTGPESFAPTGLLEQAGRWGRAVQLRPPANAAMPSAYVRQVTCASSGACIGVGIRLAERAHHQHCTGCYRGR